MHLLDVHFYYVVMYFDDIYYVLMMFGRMHTRKWDRIILFHDFLMRHLLDVHFYYVVMYFDDIYYLIMIFEGCIQENGIPEFSFLLLWVGEHS